MDILTKAFGLIERGELDAVGDLDCLPDDEDLKIEDEDTNRPKYQNAIAYNRLLPYDVDEECQQHLMRIKAHIAKCIQLNQETAYEWFIELERFVEIYGLAFTKEDHIHFVKLQYELIVSKDSMDLYYIAYVARCFSRLMKKRYLISTEELQLDWRPLYETYERLLFNETESLGLRFVPDNLESSLSQAIRLARPHFPISATQEMLDEWRPMLCPFTVSIQRAVTYFNLFLPTTLPPEHHDKGFKLWFDEVMNLWLSGKVSITANESKFTLLLSRLSSDCLGYVDWTPYIPKIFNHLKSNLNLNSAISRPQIRRHVEQLDIGPCVQWMVYMISRENSCLDHITKLFKAIESFYHPSNSDRRWFAKLQQYLHRLPACYVNRLYRERFKKNIWSKRIPESYRLTEAQTTQFVDALMPVVLTSMFNRYGISNAASAFRDLSVLRPERVVPPLLERLYGSYETLTEPHRLLATINCMASVVPAMVRPCKYFPVGPSHVLPLLLNSLPGIDSNDMSKCSAVFRFIATLAAHVKIKDYSYLVDERADLTDEQQQLCLSTAQFEYFVIQFLNKCFILIENTATSSYSTTDQELQHKNGEEGIVEASICSVTLSILAQASSEIRQAALDKLYYHVTRHIFDTKTQGKAIATICLACAKAYPKETLSKFVPHFGRLILTLTENDEVFQDSVLDNELLFSLLLMSEIVRCNSHHVLQYKDLIIDVLKRSLKLSSKEGYMLGCAILRHLLRALTNIGCTDWRNIDYDDDDEVEAKSTERTKEENNWPFDKWGHTTHIKDLKLNWVIPLPESREFAQQLLEVFLKSAVNYLLEWADGKQQFKKERVQRSLHIILSSLVGAASVLPTLQSKVIDLCPIEVPVVPICIQNTGSDPLNFADGTNIRTWVVESMMKVLSQIQTSTEDDTKSLTLVCEIFATTITYFGYNKTELRNAAQRIKSMKSSTQNKLLGSKRHLRHLLVERVAQQHRSMLLNKGHPEFTQLHMDIFDSLIELSQSHYIEVRRLAQDTIYLILNNFPFSELVLIPKLVKLLQMPNLEHNRFKGLLYIIFGRSYYSSIVIDPNWSSLRQLWPAIVKSPHSERPSIVRLLDKISGLIQKGFDTFALRYWFPDSAKQIASQMWTKTSIDLNMYPNPSDDLIESVSKIVKIRNDRRVHDYEQLVMELVELIENPHMHWHRRLVAYNLITHLTRDDHPLPICAVRLCLSSLISERLSIRLRAIQLVAAQLKLHKRKHAKRTLKVIRTQQSTMSERPSNNISDIGELQVQAEKISLNETNDLPSQDLELMQTQLTSTPTQSSARNFLSGNSNKWMQYSITNQPYSKEEWNELIFIDKPHIGFYDWPKEVEIYEPYEKQPKLDRPVEEFNDYELLVYKKFNDAEFVDKLVNYFCFEDNKGHPEGHRFDTKRPAMFKGLFRNYGPCMIEPFRKYVVEYVSESCEQKHKFVLEFLAGLLRGSKHWSHDMLVDLRQFVMPLLEQLPLTQENFNDWTGLANYVLRNRDIKRLNWLLSYFVTKATSHSESSSPTITPFLQASRLTLAHYALIQCEWRAIDHLFPLVIENLQPQDHLLAYANVRTCLASIYSLIFKFDDPTNFSRIPGTLDNGPKRKDFIESLLPRLAVLEKSKQLSSDDLSAAASANERCLIKGSGLQSRLLQHATGLGSPTLADSPSTSNPGQTDLNMLAESLLKFRQTGGNTDSISSSVSHKKVIASTNGASNDVASSLVGKLRTTLEASGVSVSVSDQLPAAIKSLKSATPTGNNGSETDESGESQEKKTAVKLMKLTSHWIVYNVCRMKTPVPADFFKLFPVICEMGREGTDPELATDSLAAVAILACSTLSSEAVVESLKCVRKIIAGHSWHARVAAAAFIEIMVSTNLFKLLNNETWRSDIEDIVINYLICDDRIEVRECSSLILSGLIHCEFTKLTPKLLSEFRRRANSPLVKKKQPNGSTVFDSKSTASRHAGILCLCACVEAYPYTVPECLPDILTLLSDYLTDPQPISTTIKKTMSNFRRTHYDNWQSDKTKFTEDQLAILADLLVSPSYYA